MQHFLASLDEALNDVLSRPKGRDFATRADQPVDAGRLLWTAARHTCLLGAGKRARPRLVHLFAEAAGAERDRVLSIAVTAELIHAASLAHDDVIDEGLLRRGNATINAKWDNLTAVLSGDLMLSLGFKELHRESTVVMISAVEVLREMSCAAIEEAQSRGVVDLPEAMWEEIAVGKTGALFGWCGFAVGQIAGDAEIAERFLACGRKLGIAFQLADDVKDVLVDDGKDRYADLKNRNPSYPLLWAVKHGHPIAEEVRQLWAQPKMSHGAVKKLGDSIAESEIIPACLTRLEEVIEDALTDLGPARTAPAGRQIERWAQRLSVIGSPTTSPSKMEA
ncbi:MAG: polyprenyl synthetase family protein [Deltaproteobacteria bacterium]|nr:polyprenyl synthetase family protein [Deltaproteobacteria bacterium]